MKNLYNLLFFFPFMVIAQTTLSAGDVIVTSLIADANDTNTIWGIFIPIVLAFFVSNLFNLYIGYKLTKE